eukprot:jgi/Astpho2/6054/Aster-04005
MTSTAAVRAPIIAGRCAVPTSRSTAARGRTLRVQAAQKDVSTLQPHKAAGLLLAGFAAMQLAAAPMIGPAQALDGPGSASGSVASSKGGGFPALPNPFASTGGTKQQTGNTGNDAKSAGVQDSIKATQGGKANEAEALSEKINNSRPSTGAPSTNTDSMKSLNTTDGNL